MPYRAKIQDFEEIARGTIAISWAKPAEFTFEAGQSIDLTLLDIPEVDRYGATRSFSIASAPSEDKILISMRLRDSAFKKKISSFPTDNPIEWDGPFGGMTLPKDNTRPLVCLAGGIGITPFRSMIREITLRRTNHQLTLLYSNKTPADSAFLKELNDTAHAFPNISITNTYTNLENIPAQNERTGRITAKMIQDANSNISDSKFYIAGPARFTSAMKQLLITMNIPRTAILNEVFDGY